MSTQSKGERKRIFVTGATGYIGGVLTEYALAEGYDVHGLSRNEAGDAKLRALGATPVRGDLTTLDVLRRESAQADIVVQLAYIHDFTPETYGEILRIDAAAVDALAEPLRGTGKPLVITSGTLVVEPDPAGGETTEESPLWKDPPLPRIRSELHALSWSEKGVRVSAIRLPPYVYGRGGKGFLMLLMQMAVKGGEAIYIGDGGGCTSCAHVDDVAKLYLLVAEQAKAGDVFNGTGSTSVTVREMAEAIGAVLKLPVRSVAREEAEGRWGPFLTLFVQLRNRASNLKAVQQLGWQPKEIDLLTDITAGSYREPAEKLLSG